MYIIRYTKQTQKDAKKIAQANLKNNVELLLNVISTDP